jgi:CheY-like chemotaxis protein
MTTVLLVDDEPDILEAWKFVLEYKRFTVRCARNGREALEAMAHGVPDIVVTDLMMPLMDGRDLCRAIRANPLWSRVPVIVHTAAYPTPSLADGSLWDAILRKPAQLDEFLAIIDGVLAKRQSGGAHS